VSCHIWLVVWIALTLMFVGGAKEYSGNFLCQVSPGMSEQQVLRAWGQPDHVQISSYVKDNGLCRVDLCTWVYDSPTRTVFFKDSQVMQCSEHYGA